MELKPLSMGVVVVVVLLSIAVQESLSRPSVTSPGWVSYHNQFGVHDPHRRATNEQCHEDSREVRELCQRCAKVTKSRLAYPMCCESRENVRDWCRELLIVG